MARADVVIIGGGVAGLWCRWRLSRAGYGVALIERTSLGDGQTVVSQGILHRGVKYALGPQGSAAARSAEAAAEVWDSAIRGDHGPDLRDIRVLARSMLMWTSSGIISKVTGAVASRLMTSHVRPLEMKELPGMFSHRAGNAYEVSEAVIEPRSVLAALAAAGAGPIARADIRDIKHEPGRVVVATDQFSIESASVVFAAGLGNESLLRLVGEQPSDWSQRRPLHMITALGPSESLFGHWIASASDKPRLTITSDRTSKGIVWYLGGEIAESGVSRTRDEQIAAARLEMKECFPSLDYSAWEFETFRVDRAEGKDAAGRRPDGPVVRSVGSSPNVIAVWPTKLVMAPLAADEVARLLEPIGNARSGGAEGFGASERPDYASPPWRR